MRNMIRNLGQLLPALVFAVVLAVPSAFADQRDNRLNDLFAQLHEAKSAGAARPIEISIWQIWTLNSDNVIIELMDEAAGAMGREDFSKALGYLDQVVAIAPDYSEGWNRRATVNYLVSRYEESLADIDRTLVLEPRHFGALAGRGLVFNALDLPEDALVSFEEALTIHPNLIGARVNAKALRELFNKQSI